MKPAAYTSMDEALDILSAYGPDLRNGMTTHAPMAAEALCALGRPEAVRPWIERYRLGMVPRPPKRERIQRDRWRDALAQSDRTSDWSAFFEEELREAPWQDVLNRWTGRLAPGLCAAAAHGVIRVGHAARCLGVSESPLRLRELADAFGYWAANYQELPTSSDAAEVALPPDAAIFNVAVVPPGQRTFAGSIVSSLVALNDFPAFAPAIGLVDVGGDMAQAVADLAQVFARVYLANVHDVLTAIVFIHGVTSVAALGNLLPYLDEATGRAALRFAWQTGCGLYASFGDHPTPTKAIVPPREDREDMDTLVDMAVTHGDEHVIKFTEACLHRHALSPSPVYLAAVRNAIDVLPRA